MSIIKSIKQVLGLGPAAENHFWDGSVPNQLSLKRGTPDAPGSTILNTKDNGITGITFANPTLAEPDGNTLNVYRRSGQLTGTTGVFSETGALIAYSWVARWVRIGRKVFLDVNVTITNLGTGGGGLIVNLVAIGAPSVASGMTHMGAGRKGNDGAMLQVVAFGANLTLFTYNNSTPIANTNLNFSVAYDTTDL